MNIKELYARKGELQTNMEMMQAQMQAVNQSIMQELQTKQVEVKKNEPVPEEIK